MTALTDLQAAVQAHLLTGDAAAKKLLTDRPTQRLAIYTFAYRARLRDALAEDFPALAAELGLRRFDRLAQAYFAAHPSRHYSIREIGRALPNFLRDYAPQRPHLSEVAQFEWAQLQAFDAADCAPVTLDEFATVPPGAWPRLSLRLAPSVQSLAFVTSAVERARALRSGETAPTLRRYRKARHCLIWRQGLEVFFRPLEAPEATALATVADGARFDALCETLCAQLDAPSVPAYAVALLKRWAQDGLIENLSID